FFQAHSPKAYTHQSADSYRRGRSGFEFRKSVGLRGWVEVNANRPSLISGDETRNAGFYHGIESDLRFDSLRNLPHRVVRNRRDVKVFLDAGGVLRRGQRSRAALDCPSEHDLRRGFVDAIGDGGDDGIFQ